MNDKKPNEILLLWSGGVHSTYVLHQLLSQSDAHIHTHFVRFDHLKIESTAREQAIKQIIPKFRSIRRFGFTYSTLELAQTTAHPNTIPMLGFYAGICLLDLKTNGRQMDKWQYGQVLSEDIHTKAKQNALAAMWPRRELTKLAELTNPTLPLDDAINTYLQEHQIDDLCYRKAAS